MPDSKRTPGPQQEKGDDAYREWYRMEHGLDLPPRPLPWTEAIGVGLLGLMLWWTYPWALGMVSVLMVVGVVVFGAWIFRDR